MENFLRVSVRVFAVALVLAPFVQATLWVLEGSTTWAAVAFFGLPATLAFFFGPWLSAP